MRRMNSVDFSLPVVLSVGMRQGTVEYVVSLGSTGNMSSVNALYNYIVGCILVTV